MTVLWVLSMKENACKKQEKFIVFAMLQKRY